MQSDIATRVGTTVGGGWRIERLLGSGGMAAVFAASHVDGRRVALKILRRELANDPPMRARFLAEADYARRVTHPDRVEVIGMAVTADDAPVLVMELLEGETLAALWKRRGRVPLRRALGIAERLLDFLDACHAVGVVHRDLKPENVFLTVDGRVKVLDFGVARGLQRTTTEPHTAVGTPEFMSPEQAHGSSVRVDARTDLYAVGAILWSIVSGSRLRQGRSADDTLEIARRERVRSLALVAPDVPRAVVAIVDRALEQDAAKRWSTARAMQAAIQRALALLDGSPTFDVPTPSSQQPTLPDTPSSLSAVRRSSSPPTMRARVSSRR